MRIEINELLENGEGLRCEFKSSFNKGTIESL